MRLSLLAFQSAKLRRLGFSLCLLAAPTMAILLTAPAWAITDLPCQNGTCQSNQDNSNIEQVAGINFNSLLKPLFSMMNYALQIYMAYQSGGAQQSAGIQAAAIKATELSTNGLIQANRMNAQASQAALAGMQIAKSSVALSTQDQDKLFTQCHAMGQDRAANAFANAQAAAYIANTNEVVANLNNSVSGTVDPAAALGAMTRVSSQIRERYGAGKSDTISVRDPITGLCTTDKGYGNGEIVAAMLEGFMPWRTNYCKKSDADAAFNMSKKHIMAGTMNYCGVPTPTNPDPEPAVSKIIDNSGTKGTPRGMTTNMCSSQGAAMKFRPKYMKDAHRRIETIDDLNEYQPLPDAYNNAVKILTKPGNENLFGLTGKTGAALDVAIQAYLRKHYHAALYNDAPAATQWVMTTFDYKQLVADEKAGVNLDTKPKAAAAD